MSNKILSVEFNGIENFHNGKFVLNFTNKQTARGEEGELTHLFSSIYTNNLIAITGINSSGKTTAAKLLTWAVEIIGSGNINSNLFIFSGDDFLDIFKKIVEIKIISYSEKQKKIFLYYAKIKNSNNRLSIIEDYIKFKTNSKLSSKNLVDFENSTLITRNDIINQFENKSGDTSMISTKINIEPDECVVKYTKLFSKVNSILIAPSRYGFLKHHLGDISSNLINYLDNSVEYLIKRTDDKTKRISYNLKFKGRDAKEIEEINLDSKLSTGTIRWIELFKSSIYILKHGGYFIVDEIELSLHKALAIDIIKLFSSKETNKFGATLIFTTHYSELLDYIKRTDSIYVTSKETDGFSKITNLSGLLKRNDRQKSDVYLKNLLDETTSPNRDIFNILVREINSTLKDSDEDLGEDE